MVAGQRLPRWAYYWPGARISLPSIISSSIIFLTTIKFRAPTIALILPQFAFPLLGAMGLQQTDLWWRVQGGGLEKIQAGGLHHGRLVRAAGRVLFFGRL